MGKSKSTRSRLPSSRSVRVATTQGPDVKATVAGLHEDLMDQIASLRCAYAVIERTEDHYDGHEPLSAARNLLYRAIQTLDEIDNRVDQLLASLSHSPKPSPLHLVPEPDRTDGGRS